MTCREAIIAALAQDHYRGKWISPIVIALDCDGKRFDSFKGAGQSWSLDTISSELYGLVCQGKIEVIAKMGCMSAYRLKQKS